MKRVLLMVGLLIFSQAILVQCQTILAPPVDYNAPGSMFYSIPADLNGDGFQDLAISCHGANLLSIRLNNGNGTFASNTDYETGNYPTVPCAADLDGDSDIDLAVPNWNQNGQSTVGIYLNNGDGSFAQGVFYPIGNGTMGVAYGDFDGDGDNDIASCDAHSDNISILMNNGDGTFAPSVAYPAGDGPSSICIAYINNDLFPDIVTANSWSNDIAVCLNNGDGTFLPAISFLAGDKPGYIASADLNGDGKSDLVVCNQISDNISILLNDGTGNFPIHTEYSVGGAPGSCLIARLGVDNDLDIAVGVTWLNDNVNVSEIEIYENIGDGTFWPKQTFAGSNLPHHINGADFDNDLDIDLVCSNTNNGISVFMNETPLPPIPPPCNFRVGDINGDCVANGIDVVYYINYLKGGPPLIRRSDCQ
jgi:hypothetical protein